MLKPIHRASCTNGLVACKVLIRTFILWLCDLHTSAADITNANLCLKMPSVIEGDWLWSLLQKIDSKRTLLERAISVADLQPLEKQALAVWLNAVADVRLHFQSPPQVSLPTTQPINRIAWGEFKTLMLAFYEKGLYQSGLPYKNDGTPTGDETLWLNYHYFRRDFLEANRTNPDPGAREICVMCGGQLTQVAVDHWIKKAAFPFLAVCPDNLVPICGECNEAPNKGEKDVHASGSFSDWFHPYLRPGSPVLQLGYSLDSKSIICSALVAADQPKVENLNQLFNLADRWTREFKAEYINQQGILLKREKKRKQSGRPLHTQAEIQTHIKSAQEDLSPTEPHYEVRSILFDILLYQSRLASWQTELALT